MPACAIEYLLWLVCVVCPARDDADNAADSQLMRETDGRQLGRRNEEVGGKRPTREATMLSARRNRAPASSAAHYRRFWAEPGAVVPAVGALLSKQARRHTPLRGQHCLLHLAVPLGR